jgi:hypothetical protein
MHFLHLLHFLRLSPLGGAIPAKLQPRLSEALILPVCLLLCQPCLLSDLFLSPEILNARRMGPPYRAACELNESAAGQLLALYATL